MRSLKLLALALLLSGCSYQTIGSPHGGEELTADFDDVQNLAVGHSVQVADVRVGTVTRVRLIGTGPSYRAQVTISLKHGLHVPQGTGARLSVTSLLGENYIELSPPDGRLNAGPFLPDHGHISSTATLPAFEQVLGKAAPLLTAIAGNDIQSIVTAGSTAFAGKGPELQHMIVQVADLTSVFARQRDQLAAGVDELARLGHDLARGQAGLDRLPQTLASSTKVLADERTKMLDTLNQISRLARTADADVLVGRTDQLRQLITELGPSLTALTSEKTNLDGLINAVRGYVVKVPRSIFNGQSLVYTVEAISFGKAAPQTDTLSQINLAMGGRS